MEKKEAEPLNRFSIISHELPKDFEKEKIFKISLSHYLLNPQAPPAIFPAPLNGLIVKENKVYIYEFRFTNYIQLIIKEHEFIVLKTDEIITLCDTETLYHKHYTFDFNGSIYHLFEKFIRPKKSNIINPKQLQKGAQLNLKGN